jgi:tryptophan 2,3-dioxygenase
MLSTTSAQQCPYAPTEDVGAAEARASRAESNGGKPTMSFDRNTPYVDYAGIDTLLSLQNPRTKEPAESAFIIGTQVMELLFALIQQRWEQARDALEVDTWFRRTCGGPAGGVAVHAIRWGLATVQSRDRPW